ncbi:hypothetical protein OIV83_000550 [Microbotryomycetes sp. JL201]|nr:hypothetical protein OIV83_000550 [Microbotryomycetes sp. JL201]
MAVIALLALFLSSLAMHCPKKLAFLTRAQPKVRKMALYASCISSLVGVVVTGVLMVQLKKSVDDFIEGRHGEASLSSGFAQLWAGLGLQVFSTLLLVAESYTKG